MRTTLDIEEDVLLAIKELSRQQNLAIGKIVSRLVRVALTGQIQADAKDLHSVAGFRPFPSRGGLATNAIVDALRDKEGV